MSGTAVCPTCGAPVSDGARFCAACGASLSEAAPEERKLATILFADVIGSTDLGEQLDPERLRALLQDYFSAMAAVVDTWGGTIEKYIGDAILAVWGVPAAREDDPIRALHAAREMVVELDRLNPDLEHRHGVRLGLRIGVNTGEVLAPVGAQRTGQFLVSGDAVNVASRLQQAAEPSSVLVGERTWAGARHAFEFADAVALAVKGKRAPVTARALRDPIETHGGGDGQRPLHAPMLGRERELNTLVGLLDEVVEDGEPRLVLVTGPAGMGKSRMLREFIGASTRAQPNLAVLRGRCLATGHGITFWALGEILRLLCAISLDEPADGAGEKLRQRVAGPLAQVGLGPDEIARTIAALAVSANLNLPDNPLRSLGPEEMADEMAHAWPRLLTGLARSQPMAVVIEDIHWADEPMLRMLEALATRARGPLLIVATARPEFLEANSGFGAGADVSIISLRALSDTQAAQLIGDLLGSTDLPPALIQEIQHKADGNPFFLEEIVQRLIDEGALVATGDGKWHATERAASIQLPDTIYALLAARIDALPTDEKRLLQEAAVVGRVFWPGALPADVAREDVLRRAERRGLVSLRAASTIENESEYIFRHVLIRDVAYNSVPRKRRALAHADTGAWIEKLTGERADEFAELIAYHYAAAVSGADADLGWSGDEAGREAVRRRAFAMLLSAAQAARRRFAIDKALDLDAQALALAADDFERPQAHEALGDDHEALYHGDEAVREYLAGYGLAETGAGHRVSELSATAGGIARERRARLAGKAGRMVLRWGAFQSSAPFDDVQRVINIELANPASERDEAMLLMVNGGLIRGDNGVPIGAGRVGVSAQLKQSVATRIASIEDGIRIARRLDDVELLFMGSDLLVMAYQSVADYPSMRAAAESQAAILNRVSSVRQQVDALVSIASTRSDAGLYDQALEAAEDGYRRSVGLSEHERMHIAYELIAAAELSGRWDRVAQILPWFAAAAAAEGDITCASVRAGPPYGATVLARRGATAEALALVPLAPTNAELGTFVAVAHTANYATLVASPEVARASVSAALQRLQTGFLELGIAPMLEALERMGMYDEMEAFLPTAQGQTGATVTIEPALGRAEALLALRRGDTKTAQALLRQSLAAFQHIGTPFEIARTMELLARIVYQPERGQLRDRAREIYVSLGAQPFAAQIEQELARS